MLRASRLAACLLVAGAACHANPLVTCASAGPGDPGGVASERLLGRGRAIFLKDGSRYRAGLDIDLSLPTSDTVLAYEVFAAPGLLNPLQAAASSRRVLHASTSAKRWTQRWLWTDWDGREDFTVLVRAQYREWMSGTAYTEPRLWHVRKISPSKRHAATFGAPSTEGTAPRPRGAQPVVITVQACTGTFHAVQGITLYDVSVTYDYSSAGYAGLTPLRIEFFAAPKGTALPSRTFLVYTENDPPQGAGTVTWSRNDVLGPYAGGTEYDVLFQVHYANDMKVIKKTDKVPGSISGITSVDTHDVAWD